MSGERDILRELSSSLASGEIQAFEPRAHYYEAMDFLLYLQEDVPYRADRIDAFLTLLWHPEEEKAIGVKIKGVRVLFDYVMAILKTKNIDFKGTEFLPFVTALQAAMTAGLGEKITLETERQRLIDEGYATAKALVGSVEFDARALAA